MTDKKFTDEEIIKALECCANGKCRECPLFKEDCGDDRICKNALDLITHLQEENETLKEFIVETRRCDKEIKSEAVKECLAKVKNYIKAHCNPYGKPDFDYDTSIKILNFIDNLVVGE